MIKRVIFNNRVFPYLLLLPQVLVILIFFYGPAVQTFLNSFLLANPFGFGFAFVWFQNYASLLASPEYRISLANTVVFSVGVMALSLVAGLLFATAVNRVIRGSGAYKTLIILPYAIAPVLAGVLWLFIFHPTFGVLSFVLRGAGVAWNPKLDGGQAMTLVIIAASWKQISYNFVFFLAGLQAIPKAVIEAAAVDGANAFRRFRYVAFPLLTPTTFFLMVVNVVYAFFDTFGIIHAITEGGPGQATNILVYKVFADGFVGLNLGSSSAQSAILMFIVIVLTVVQFRYIEGKVQYEMT
jgi:sn-glycerol 3-phosphate transport system permease protein